MTETYQFSRSSRTPQMVVTLGMLYTVLILLFFSLDAAWWIVSILALPTIPAVWDCWRNTHSGLTLNSDQIEWYSGRRTDNLPLEQIDRASFNTRFDFSVRITLILKNGRKLYLPSQVIPPRRQLEPELQERGIPTKRYHFRFF
ncbi:hypothetical protein [Parasedimentitalea denitrificans]|uniref:hypothetical protein n=1 Tax=Parasedimentitalea denitrificans TaxID=2211118 RepID=UPI0014313520|nr:hypothetical protein [Sedimentitalea sp. CY04]